MIYDFDAKFYEYVSAWVARHPKMKPEEVEDHFNELMEEWLNAPAAWLDGIAPGAYFASIDSPEILIDTMETYDAEGIGLPEPLYTRIVELGEACADRLKEIIRDESRSEALRNTALSMINEIGGDDLVGLMIDILLEGEAKDDAAEMAAEALSERVTPALCETLMDEYEDASECARDRILEVCSNGFWGSDRLGEVLIERLYDTPMRRSYYAALLGKIGYLPAAEPLKKMMALTETGYLDYLEMRNAVEMLGEDPGPERQFDGDADYEALCRM